MADEPWDMIWFFEEIEKRRRKRRFKNWEEQDAYARKHNIHPVCLMCRHKCKKPYSFWDSKWPPDIFCEYFDEKED